MRIVVLVLGLLFTATCTYAQELSTNNKKAIKYYNQAAAAIKQRDFDLGILLYKKAIEKDKDFAQAYLRLAGTYSVLREMDSSFMYYERYWARIPEEKADPRVAALLSQLYFDRGRYTEARATMDVAVYKDPRKKASLLDRTIDFALDGINKPVSIKVEFMPAEVNQFYSQYFPAITIDNQALFFTKRDGGSQMDDEDIVVAYRVDDGWTIAESISSNINSVYNEGACSISADGRTLIFTSCEDKRTFGSCDLFIATREGDTWSKPQNLGSAINSRYWDSQPTISADGRSIYFSSNRPGGVGKRDLWVSQHNGRLWEKPINLGEDINTPGDETTPYIHVNGESLFFASNGREGFGGYDLYSSEKLDSGWSTVTNLGYGINDHFDQLSMVITADGRHGFFARETRNPAGGIESRLVTIALETDTLVSHISSYMTGRVLDINTREPLPAKIELYNLNTSAQQYVTLNDPVTGVFFFALNADTEYGSYVTSDGYLFEDFRFEAQQNTALKPDTLDILLTPIAEGAALVLENIYFDFNSYQIDDRSRSELDVIAQYIQDAGIRVEISGHTDRVGTEEYNLRLSKLRAEAVYYYLINKGVKPADLQYQGYGSARLIHSEADSSSLNRRIEFEILQVKD